MTSLKSPNEEQQGDFCSFCSHQSSAACLLFIIVTPVCYLQSEPQEVNWWSLFFLAHYYFLSLCSALLVSAFIHFIRHRHIWDHAVLRSLRGSARSAHPCGLKCRCLRAPSLSAALTFWRQPRRWTELIRRHFVLMRCLQLVRATLSGATRGLKVSQQQRTPGSSENLVADTQQPESQLSISFNLFILPEKTVFLSVAAISPAGIIMIQFVTILAWFSADSCFTTCITHCHYRHFQSTICALHSLWVAPTLYFRDPWELIRRPHEKKKKKWISEPFLNPMMWNICCLMRSFQHPQSNCKILITHKYCCLTISDFLKRKRPQGLFSKVRSASRLVPRLLDLHQCVT